jgi:phosphate transport system permease protein
MANKIFQKSIYYTVIALFSAVTLIFLVWLVSDVLIHGLPHINLEFLTDRPRLMGRSGGVFPIIIATLYVMLIAVAISAPIGIGAAIYFTEYAKNGKFLQFIRLMTEVLAGIPSIIFGLFGFAFFVVFCGLGWSVLSGGLTLSLMILPIIIRSTEESIKAVPKEYKEGSLSLGAGTWYTIFHVILPCCIRGIATGLILGIGRAVGEAAAVFLTLGGALKLPLSPMDSGRTLAMHMYTLASEGLSTEKAYATAALLIIIILIINTLANLLFRSRIGK